MATTEPAHGREGEPATNTDQPSRPVDGTAAERRDGALTPAAEYERIQASPEFQNLKDRFRKFVFAMTAAFLGWYLLFVLCSSYAKDFMGTKLIGNINVALVFGLLQFVSTFVIAWLYSRYASSQLDPIADDLQERIERDLA